MTESELYRATYVNDKTNYKCNPYANGGNNGNLSTLRGSGINTTISHQIIIIHQH